MGVEGPEKTDKPSPLGSRALKVFQKLPDGSEVEITAENPYRSRYQLEQEAKSKTTAKVAAQAAAKAKLKAEAVAKAKKESDTHKETAKKKPAAPRQVTLPVTPQKKDVSAVAAKSELRPTTPKPDDKIAAAQKPEAKAVAPAKPQEKLPNKQNLAVAELPTFPGDRKYIVPSGLTDKGNPVTLFGIAFSIRKSLPATKEEFDSIPSAQRYLTWNQVTELKKTPALLLARALDTSLIKLKLMPKHEDIDPLPPSAGTAIDLKTFFSSLTVDRIKAIQASEGTRGGVPVGKRHEYLTAEQVWELATKTAKSLVNHYQTGATAAQQRKKPDFIKVASFARLSNYSADLAENLYHLSKIESSWDKIAASSKDAYGLTQVRDIAAKDVGLLNSDWRTSPTTNMFAGGRVLTKNLERFRTRNDDPFTDLLLTSTDKEVVKFRQLYTSSEITNLFKSEGNLMHALAAYNIGPTAWAELPSYVREDQADTLAAAARYIAKFLTARKQYPVSDDRMLAQRKDKSTTVRNP